MASSEKCEDFQSNGLPGINCIFEDDVKPQDSNSRVGSLMYRPFLSQVRKDYFATRCYFCFKNVLTSVN